MPVLLDISRLLPGPLCARILADSGWEVHRWERPGGEITRHWAPELYAWLQTHKHIETVDLKQEAGRARFRERIAQVDALLETNRPGVMERLGLGYAELVRINPRLTYVRLMGSREEARRGQPGHDLTYLAGSGMLERVGEAWRSVQLADVAGALWAALALERVFREGGGYVEVYLEEAPFVFGYPPLPLLDGRLVSYHVYAAARGHVALAALEPSLWAMFCEVAGKPAWKGKGRTPATEDNPVFLEVQDFFRTRAAACWDQWAVEHRLPLRAVHPWHMPAHLCPWHIRPASANLSAGMLSDDVQDTSD